MRSTMLWIWLALGLGSASMASGQGPEAFPDAWFYSEAERPKELRGLEGQKASEISTTEWRGEQLRLGDLRGKVVVLDFWATWCGPCMAAIPKNVEMVNKYQSEGLRFIGLHDSNSGWDKVDGVISSKNINYPVALDDSGKSTKAYKLRFWPTYVVIDRDGIIRGAGLKPGNVEDAVKLLLAEPYDGPVAVGTKPGGFDDKWFYGGEKRPAASRKAEGQRFGRILAASWSGTPLEKSAWQHKVLVLQLVNPAFPTTQAQVEKLAAVNEKYARQGVACVAVCDARADFEKFKASLDEQGIKLPVAQDEPVEDGKVGSGKTGQKLGARGPVLAVIDRAGVVRAVGLHPSHLEKVINTLLAEPLPPIEKADSDRG